jgi:hypothetical protein
MTKDVDEKWTPGEQLPTKKGLYFVRISAPGASPPFVELEDVKWTGKKWREDDQFDIPNESIVSWRLMDTD